MTRSNSTKTASSRRLTADPLAATIFAGCKRWVIENGMDSS
jgi:hypothetical protein